MALRPDRAPIVQRREPEYGCEQDLIHDSATVWKSEDDVFTVGNKSGVVTGISVGIATAEVKHRSSTDTASVTVIP